MKISLRNIAVFIILVMLGVFLYQLYWLNGLYQTTSKQFDKDVYNAIDIADQFELGVRTEWLDADTTKLKSLSMNVGMKTDSVGQDVYFSVDKESKDTVNQSNLDSAGFNSYTEKVQTTGKLAAYIKKTMHYGADQFFPINIAVLDSVLTAQLVDAGIKQAHQIFVVKTANNSICLSGKKNAHFNIKNARQYDYYYDFNGAHSFRLYVKNPNTFLLKQMLGMLLTSLLVLVFLIVTFVYLLRSIRKLQTEEELKTNFTNNMTHELKTPIAVSYAAIDALLVADAPVSEERKNKYLNIAKDQMESLSGLVEQILNMSRKDNKHIELNIEQVDLAEVVSTLSEKLRLVAGKEVVIEMNLQVSSLKADKLHLTNMLNNLMENGIKYSGVPTKLKISSFLSGKEVAISVEDNGIGIDAKHQDKLFDKFYRVPTGNKHDVKGFGLGLFYVKEMVEKHGGTIDVSSQFGKGAVFTIKIPQ